MSMGQTNFMLSRGRELASGLCAAAATYKRRTTAKQLLHFAAVGLLLAAPCACRFAQAQSSGADAGYSSDSASQQTGPTIDLDVANAPLLSVVQALKLRSHAQIVVVHSSRYQPVTLTVTAPLGEALQYVAQSAGAEVTRDGNGVYTFRPIPSESDQAPATVTAASYQPANLNPEAAPPVPEADMHMERIPLQFVSPDYVLTMLNMPEGFRNADPVVNSLNNKLERTVDRPEVTLGNNGSTTELNPYTATNTGAPTQQPGVPLPNGGASGGADKANQYPGQFGGGGFGGPSQVINPGGINSTSAPPQAALGFGQPGGNAQNTANSLRPQGIDSITSNEQDNSLIVRGTPEGITELKQIIGFLDRAPRQVQIKVEYVTTEVANIDQFGINWAILPIPNVSAGFNGGGAATGATGTSFLTYAQGNIVSNLLALLQNGKTKLVSAPIITTTNNTQAFVNFGTEVPYQTTSTVAQGSGNAINSTSVNFLNVPNNLTILPRINGDDSVSLLLQPTLGTIVSSGSATLPPTVNTQSVSTYRTVANGETMVIGGLVSKTITQVQYQVPFLGALPIIGNLFRTRNTNISDTELLIFVTPTVLPPIGSGLSTTPSEAGIPTSGDSSAGVGVTP